MKEEKCRYCGKVLTKEERFEFDGKVMCEACFESLTSVCNHCGERIWNDENSGSSNFILCQRCYDNHYTTCERCGTIIHYDSALYFDDDDNPYCHSCYEIESKDQSIHDYNYKPEPIFYGDDDMYMGVELEIDHGGENSDSADELLYIANFPNERMYMKHDGSIVKRNLKKIIPKATGANKTSNHHQPMQLKGMGLGRYRFPLCDEVPEDLYYTKIIEAREKIIKDGRQAVEVFYEIQNAYYCNAKAAPDV